MDGNLKREKKLPFGNDWNIFTSLNEEISNEK